MRLIDADRLNEVLNINFGHTGGADVLRQLIDIQPTVQAIPIGVLQEIRQEIADIPLCTTIEGILAIYKADALAIVDKHIGGAKMEVSE